MTAIEAKMKVASYEADMKARGKRELDLNIEARANIKKLEKIERYKAKANRKVQLNTSSELKLMNVDQQIGYIEGYTMDNENELFAIVILDNSFHAVPTRCLTII